MPFTPEQLAEIRAKHGIAAPASSPINTTDRTSRFDAAWSETQEPTNKPSLLDRAKGVGMATLKGGPIAGITEVAKQAVDVIPEGLNYPKKVVSSATQGAKKAVEGFKDMQGAAQDKSVAEGTQGLYKGALKSTSGAIETLSSPFTALFGVAGEVPGIKQIVETIKKQVVDPSADAISENKALQRFMVENPESDQVVADLINVIGSVVGGKKAPEIKSALEPVASTASKVIDTTTGAVKSIENKITSAMTPTEQVIDDFVTTKYEKAIKPTIVGRKTIGTADQYKNRTINAVDTIVENKKNLKFITEDGAEEIGRTPQSVREFAEAIDQTKNNIYTQYNNLAKQAGQKGVEVDLKPIVSELDVVINNKALNLSHPEAVSYAKALKERFNETGRLDTETAEQVIKNYNSSLESFYRNPTYDNASRAAIDAGIVNIMRKSLDDVIENSTGQQYQALKDKYGALKTIEKDVVKRANIVARQNEKGLIDYADIFSGGEIISGILTLNPALFAKGVAQKGITTWFKFLNDPNKAVNKLFDMAENRTSKQADQSLLTEDVPDIKPTELEPVETKPVVNTEPVVNLDMVDRIKKSGKRQNRQTIKELFEGTDDKPIKGYVDISKLKPTQYVDPYSLKEYRYIIKNGDESPIIGDFRGGKFDVYDGHHRLEAYRSLGYKEVPIVTQADAIKQLNKDRGVSISENLGKSWVDIDSVDAPTSSPLPTSKTKE